MLLFSGADYDHGELGKLLPGVKPQKREND